MQDGEDGTLEAREGQSRGVHPRDPQATRRRILEAALTAFAAEGLDGARIDRIARAAEANVQMIYRYFGDKEGLYRAALEETYGRIRILERQLDLGTLPPQDGIRLLIEFTFDYLCDNPDFVSIIRGENMSGGRFVRQLAMVPDTTQPLVEALAGIVLRGQASGVFTAEVDTTQLYVTILSLCMTHLSQRATLSAMFQRDLGNREWLAARRAHVVDVVLAFLTIARPAAVGMSPNDGT